MRIAILDAESTRADAIRKTFENTGHVCERFDRGRSFLRVMGRQTYDLVIVCHEVPDTGSRFIIEQLQGRNVARACTQRVPTVAIERCGKDGGVRSMVQALQAGADDCLLEPLNQELLLARAHALLRLLDRQGSSTEPHNDFGTHVFDPDRCRVSSYGQPVDLTPKEFELAHLLFSNRSRHLSRDYIIKLIWKREDSGCKIISRSLDTHISRVRKKLELHPERGYRLKPIYSYGYCLDRLAARAPRDQAHDDEAVHDEADRGSLDLAPAVETPARQLASAALSTV